jgi:hypothetical protein
VNGRLDFKGTGVDRDDCSRALHEDGGEHHHADDED